MSECVFKQTKDWKTRKPENKREQGKGETKGEQQQQQQMDKGENVQQLQQHIPVIMRA